MYKSLMAILLLCTLSGCTHQILEKSSENDFFSKKEAKISRTDQDSFENHHTTGYHTNSEQAIGLGIPSFAKFAQIFDSEAFTTDYKESEEAKIKKVSDPSIPYIINGFYAPSFQ